MTAPPTSAGVDVPPLRAPVVVVVLDEVPAATIMRGDGTINADRYPGFAKLAAVSTWFRNVSSPRAHTPQAVPAVLTGKVTNGEDLPTYGDHPENLFTLLGRDVPVHRYEAVTDLCPPDICVAQPRQPLRQALQDASIVYGHRVLPEELRDGLPAIDRSWGAYGSGTDTTDDRPATREERIGTLYQKWRAMGQEERSIRGQARVLADSLGAITAAPSVHMVHVSLPHRPWTLSRRVSPCRTRRRPRANRPRRPRSSVPGSPTSCTACRSVRSTSPSAIWSSGCGPCPVGGHVARSLPRTTATA